MLTQPCTVLTGIGPTLAAKLAKCGIHTVQDLLFHLPLRYQDRTHITPIRDLRAKDWCVIEGSVCNTEITFGKRRMLFCYVQDKTGIVKLRFFHFNQQQVHSLRDNPRIRAFGEINGFANNLELIHPEYQLLQGEEVYPVEETLTPIYPSTQGLSQHRLRQLIKQALHTFMQALHSLEWMTPEQLMEQGFHAYPQAIDFLHNPPPGVSSEALATGHLPALQRIIFDELLAQRVSLQFAKQKRQAFIAAQLPPCSEQEDALLAQLPFTLTGAQRRVCAEVSNDLQQNKPMLRLVQGDVGAGKTLICAWAALQALANGYQVAFMAPTDLLSEQHAHTLSSWFTPLGITMARLSGKSKARERKQILADLADGRCQLLIGTHALFQQEVVFNRLGLIIIDEQHRFGVEQRLLLQQKGQHAEQLPHQLLLTATPIPRTLAMTHFAHLDISILDELPPGRTPITTAVINQDKRQPVIERLQTALEKGRQAYWVCTLVEESEKLQCMAATETAEYLGSQLPAAKVGLVHGRMKQHEKEATMAAFKQGTIHLLVATTVIEVGVDVPNASLMIIENAERLGLSQLHQLRGRVGRGDVQSHCLLLYQPPLSQLGKARLHTLRETNDGFAIAEKDLQLRGSGELLGTRQAGYRHYKIANLPRDQLLLSAVNRMANRLLKEEPMLAHSIAKRWLGDFETYFQG